MRMWGRWLAAGSKFIGFIFNLNLAYSYSSSNTVSYWDDLYALLIFHVCSSHSDTYLQTLCNSHWIVIKGVWVLLLGVTLQRQCWKATAHTELGVETARQARCVTANELLSIHTLCQIPAAVCFHCLLSITPARHCCFPSVCRRSSGTSQGCADRQDVEFASRPPGLAAACL